MEQKSHETPSPSASSGFLPLGRRGSRGSLSTTQTDRENINTALDQIHNAAYQSDSLTLFNEFTSPPAPAPASDDKGLSEELQGGLSGLYSRFRTSVGGMRDIVSGGAKTADKNAADSSMVKTPSSERSMTKSISDLTVSSADIVPSYPNSSQGSRLHSPVVPSFHPSQVPTQQSTTGKSSKLSSKSASIASKASISAAPAGKSNIAPLSKTTGNSAAADPSVTPINVGAIGQTHHSRSSSVNVPSQAFQNAESSSIGSRDVPTDMSASQTSSVLNPGFSYSPVLSPKTHGSLPEESNSLEASGSSITTNHVLGTSSRKSSNADQSRAPDDISHFTATRASKPSELAQESKSNTPESGSNPKLSTGGRDDSATPAALSNNFPKMASQAVGSVDSASDSTAPTPRDGAPVGGPANPSILMFPTAGKSQPQANKNRLPGYVMSRASTAETTTTVSSLPPLNTAVPRITTQGPGRIRSQAAGDGVLSQLRSRLLSRDFWMRDENAKDCFHCGEPFTTFRRKHHCRTCGQIFDSKCTLLVPGTRFGQPGTIRVCKPCEGMINAHDDDSSEYSDSEQSPIIVNPRTPDLGWGSSGARPSGEDDDAASIRSQSIDQVLRTPTMAIPATRRSGEGHNRGSAVLEINSDRPLTRPTSSRSLRSSLGVRPHSISHKRHHSRQQYIRSFKPAHDDRAPFQRRHPEDLTVESRLPAFHKDNIIDPDLAQYLSDDASSGDEQPSLLSAVSENNLSKSGGDTERAAGLGGFLAAMKKGRSAFGDRNAPSVNNQSPRDADEASITSSRAVNLPRSSRRRNLSVASSVHVRHSPRTSKDSIYPHDPTFPAVPFVTSLKQSGFKMTRSSSMRGTGAPPIELNKASREHVQKLLRQLLVEASLPNSENWEKALMPILLKAADEVDPDVQRGDDMDIRHYIKLKKIPGGRPGDTSYVSGLVFTKNLALKSMPRSIPRPNILIITFPLEYARQQQQFMSLEPVIRQEREFLENLVSRIAALHPNLLLVETNVSGLALALLEQAGIATAYNVKPSVLEAVSRCTQTRIVTSMDKLLTATLHSDCSSFDVKTYVHGGRRKTYMYISGCPKELGCTIVLRGGDEGVLGKVKHITEFMVYVVYNLRLETYLMRDEFAKLPAPTGNSADQIVCSDDKKANSHLTVQKNSARATEASSLDEKAAEDPEHPTPMSTEIIEVPDDVPMPTYHNDMVQDHQTKILSASPSVKFELPYLLMRTREMERRLAYLKRLRDQVENTEETSEEKTKPQKFILITPEMVHTSPADAPPKVKEVLRAAHDAEYDRALYHYQTQKRQWEAYVSGNSNMFDPYAHQNIVVLFSLVCTTTSVPCSGPDIFALEFYNEHGDDTIFEPDCTIGQYVEDLCHTANAVCNVNGCEKRMFEHHRQYVHGDAQISVLVQPYPSKLRGMQDTVLMWSTCKICGNETQVTLMSENTWKYSFGKYLEVSFWGRNMHARAGVCPHDLQRDHLRYFGFKDVAVRVQYDRIHLLEIVVPRPRVTWKVDNDLKLRNQIYSDTSERLNKFMKSVHVRLKGINVESVLPELLDECKREIEALIKKAHEDHATLNKRLQDRYTSSRYWEVIPLNKVLRAIQEKVVEWDTIFAEFEKNFFPSEKDIKRLAALQLKKIFLDKDATSMTTEDSLHTPGGMEDETTPTDEKPRIMRRMTLSPEKAQNVLVSVVEEHTGRTQRDTPPETTEVTPLPTPTHESALSVDTINGRKSSPQDEAVLQEEVRHLDLAVPSGQSERLAPGASTPLDRTLSRLDDPAALADCEPVYGTRDNTTPSPPDACEPFPETKGKTNEENSTTQISSTPPNRPSAIPRLAEGAFRRSGKTRSPPLIRAQSQPAHLVREKSFGLKLSHTNSNESGTSRSDSTKSSERKFTERLGLTALKNGRFAPGHSLIPRSTPKRGNTRVSNLARHFEQLSREFEKERQRERRQRAARNTYSRAFPLASSKPIVEVYRNVKDAVEEREPHVDGDDSLPAVRQRPSEETGRKSDDFMTRRDPEEPLSKSPAQETPSESFGSDGLVRSDSQLMSEGEGDDGRSDEERTTAEDLHHVDSQDDAKTLPDDDSIDFKDLPKHERTTLLKMLTNFWSERSASGWTALDYPLSAGDHVFSDCDIIVREDEPSSLIAFALDSSDYKDKLTSIKRKYDMEDQPPNFEHDTEAANEARLEHALLRQTGTHLKYQFQEGQAKMLCKVFYAEQFEALRQKCGVADRIVESLSRCLKWDSKGGKTKSIFLKTLDDRFVLKSLAPVETQAFLKFAPAYFQIMSEALFHDLPSAIAKMFGFYQIIIKNPVTGIEQNSFLLLMENLFYDRAPNRLFDLKGSMRNRKVESTGEQDEVLLDENMVDFIYETPLFAREHSKKLLSQSVWNDTLFLGRQNVMDYSLMIAIDEKRSELVVGIIDCIRTYTWDKKLESWIKDRGFAGGGRNRPTVTSPREYKSRFREAMARYVLQAPRYALHTS
ncbi:1-phosphatidylinositol 3-phosphate 5-kinase FAB1 [Penicillium rolfsii]|nr:1-phosphatidylinositol 3-phosphate 5-kinase FAB1 [Penicillium rolfsii]